MAMAFVMVLLLFQGLIAQHAGPFWLMVTLPFFGAPPGGPYLAPLDASVLAVVFTGLRAGGRHRSSLDVGVVAFGVVTVAAFIVVFLIVPVTMIQLHSPQNT